MSKLGLTRLWRYTYDLRIKGEGACKAVLGMVGTLTLQALSFLFGLMDGPHVMLAILGHDAGSAKRNACP